MKKVFAYECGGNLGNVTTPININEPVDFALAVGNKSYRMQADKEGNLFISLINGVDVKFTSRNGYPTICLTQSMTDSDGWYDRLKDYSN